MSFFHLSCHVLDEMSTPQWHASISRFLVGCLELGASPHHLFSHPVMSCHVMSCHVMSCHVMSCHVMFDRVISQPLESSNSWSCFASMPLSLRHVKPSCHVTSRHEMLHCVLSHFLLYCASLCHLPLQAKGHCSLARLVRYAVNAGR